jgi:hypothetical protein
MDPGIRIRTNMSRIPNTAYWETHLISGLYLDVFVDNVLAGEAVLFLHIFRVTEYTVAGVEVVVRPPRRELKSATM